MLESGDSKGASDKSSERRWGSGTGFGIWGLKRRGYEARKRRSEAHGIQPMQGIPNLRIWFLGVGVWGGLRSKVSDLWSEQIKLACASKTNVHCMSSSQESYPQP